MARHVPTCADISSDMTRHTCADISSDVARHVPTFVEDILRFLIKDRKET
ncbi:MAG: hypothetical protein HDS16_05975 [Bacteroides sp.]|nr:hypothetical protein [Bacteroides sp.]